MYLPLIHQIVHSEMELDRLRKIEYQILLDAIERDRMQKGTSRKVFGWLGTQMVAWGTRLQGSPNIDTGCQETTLPVSITAHKSADFPC